MAGDISRPRFPNVLKNKFKDLHAITYAKKITTKYKYFLWSRYSF